MVKPRGTGYDSVFCEINNTRATKSERVHQAWQKLSDLVLRNVWIATHCLDIYIFLRKFWKVLKACISPIQYWPDKHQT